MDKKWKITGVLSLIIIPLFFFILSSGEEEETTEEKVTVTKKENPPKKGNLKPKYQIYPEIEEKKEPQKIEKVVTAEKKTKQKPKKEIKQESLAGFEKIGESTYRITDRSQLSEIAVLAANEFAQERLDIWGDFDKAIGGDPVSVLDECTNSYYELVPLYIYNEYAGFIQSDNIDKNTIKISPVLPSSFFHSINLSESYDKFIPIDKDEGIILLEKKLNIDTYYLTYNNLVLPCIGENDPLNPKISPFHSFSIEKEKYLVNIRDGEIITEQNKKEIEFELSKIKKEFENRNQ